MTRVAERTIRRAADHDFEVRVSGATVTFTVVQPKIDPQGLSIGQCRIDVVGQRVFGGAVEFSKPFNINVTDPSPGEEAAMRSLGVFAIEALAEIDSQNRITAISSPANDVE